MDDKPDNDLRACVAMAAVLLDKAAALGTADAANDRRDEILARHGATLTPEDDRRLTAQCEIAEAFFAAAAKWDAAHRSGDQAGMADLKRQMDSLHRQAVDIAAFRGFSDPAEQLCRADTFDDFAAAVPAVKLDRLYGGDFGKTSAFPLIWAMKARDRPLERVQLLLRAGARTDLTTRLGNTVLHAMAGMKRKARVRLPILRALLLRGADLEARNIYGETALEIALDRGSVEDAGHFLAAGARIGRRELETAAEDPARMALVLKHLPVGTQSQALVAELGPWLRGRVARSRQDLQELHEAGKDSAWSRRVLAKRSAALALLRQADGYSDDAAGRKSTWAEQPAAFIAVETAPTTAYLRRSLKRIDLRSYPPDLPDQPIYWPIRARTDRPRRLWLMLSAGAQVRGGPNGEALHILAQQRLRDAAEQARMVQLLVQSGADLEARNYDGLTPLALATSIGGLSEFRALLEAGARSEVQVPWHRYSGRERRVPLLFAAADDARKFRRLVDGGANMSVRARGGQTLTAFLTRELSAARDLGQGEFSGNFRRLVDRRVRNLAKSLDIVGAPGV